MNELFRGEIIGQINLNQDTVFEQLDFLEEVNLSETKNQVVIDATDDQPLHREDLMKTAPNLLIYPEFLVFTSLHNVYKIQNRAFMYTAEIIEQIEFEENEKPIYLTGTKNYIGYLFVAFENGKAGKISFSSYQTEGNRKKLKNAFSNDSKLVFIEHIEYDVDLVALSSIGKIALFNTGKINSVDSRASKGVQVMKPKDGSFMKAVKNLNQVKFIDPEYYRKDGGLNIVGFYLRPDDEF